MDRSQNLITKNKKNEILITNQNLRIYDEKWRNNVKIRKKILTKNKKRKKWFIRPLARGQKIFNQTQFHNQKKLVISFEFYFIWILFHIFQKYIDYGCSYTIVLIKASAWNKMGTFWMSFCHIKVLWHPWLPVMS